MICAWRNGMDASTKKRRHASGERIVMPAAEEGEGTAENVGPD
jgi:hypothetical protein